MYVIWSSTYLAMQIAVHDMPPLWMAGMRFVGAGAILLVIARVRGASWPCARDWLRALPAGACLFVGGNGLVATAERSVASGGAAVVCATMPLWVGVLGALAGHRPTRREWFALVLGFAGVVVLMGGPSLAGTRVDLACLIASPILWGLGSVLTRRAGEVHCKHGALVTPALQLACGGVLLMMISGLRGDPFPVHAGTTAWLALAYLLVVGSLVGFTAYSWLLRNARPAVATSYAYVNPVVAVLIGAFAHGEPIGTTTVIANVMILLAIWLALSRSFGRAASIPGMRHASR